jgi:hemolysin D
VLSTIGGIVQPAQALMVVVPDGREIEVEAHWRIVEQNLVKR